MTPEEFIANFQTVAEAPGGIKKLREMVLDLAVRGKLTSKSAPRHHDPRTGPFAIPSHWEWTHGSSVFVLVTSGSRGWAQYYAIKGPIFLRIGNLDYATTRLDLSSIQRVEPPPNAEGTRTRVQPGDVLISITGDTGMVGLVPSDLGEAYINQHIALARPASSIFSEYIALALTAPFSLGRLQAAQRGIKNSLGLDDIRNLRFPLPPLAEQKRIVAKVDQLMALCDDLEARQAKKRETAVRLNRAALDALTTADGPEEVAASFRRVAENFDVLVSRPASVDALRETILVMATQGHLVPQDPNDGTGNELLDRLRSSRRRKGRQTAKLPDGSIVIADDGITVPATWALASLIEVAEVIDPNPSHRYPSYKDGVVPLLSTREFSGVLDWDVSGRSIPLVPNDVYAEQNERCRFLPTDIIFARKGRLGLARHPPRLSAYVFSHTIFVIKPELDMFSDYLLLYLRSNRIIRWLRKEMNDNTGVPTLGKATTERLPVPIPPLAEQKRIVAKVDQLMALCDTLEAALRRAESTAQKLAEAVVAELVA